MELGEGERRRRDEDGRGSSVPVSYAERAMNSLMALHGDLMSEKERVLDLTRRLMEERQGRAELEAYVRLLESELRRHGGPELSAVRVGRGDDLSRVTERLLEDRPPPPDHRPPPMARPATAPLPGDRVTAPPEAAAPEGPRPPAPPPPSASYRAPTPTPTPTPSPPPATSAASAGGTPDPHPPAGAPASSPTPRPSAGEEVVARPIFGRAREDASEGEAASQRPPRQESGWRQW